MYNINRFLEIQKKDYSEALQEIKNGLKTSHWIWYIFPQLKELGRSSTAVYYGIDGIEEAEEYYNNPTLKEHLIEITKAVLIHKDKKTALEIFGETDSKKLKSCMTLFDMIEPDSVFNEVLNAFFDGKRDNRTIEIINGRKDNKYEKL